MNATRNMLITVSVLAAGLFSGGTVHSEELTFSTFSGPVQTVVVDSDGNLIITGEHRGKAEDSKTDIGGIFFTQDTDALCASLKKALVARLKPMAEATSKSAFLAELQAKGHTVLKIELGGTSGETISGGCSNNAGNILGWSFSMTAYVIYDCKFHWKATVQKPASVVPVRAVFTPAAPLPNSQQWGVAP